MSILFEKKLMMTLLGIFVILEAVIFLPGFKAQLAFLLVLFVASALFWILQFKPKERKSYPIFILPIVLSFETLVALDSVVSPTGKHILALFSVAVLYLVIFSLEAIRQKIVSYAVIVYNILSISSMIGAFLGFVLFYQVFGQFSLPLWLGMILSSFIAFLFFMFTLWHNDLLKRRTLIFAIISSFIIMEFFWALSFLPLLPLQNGFLLFLLYYIYTDLFVLEARRKLTSKKIMHHVVVPAFVLIFLIFSIKW